MGGVGAVGSSREEMSAEREARRGEPKDIRQPPQENFSIMKRVMGGPFREKGYCQKPQFRI